MDSPSLIRMANSIGDFFEALPDRDEGIEGIATHIRKFWEPRMRKQLLVAFDEGGHGASEIVLQAIERFRATIA